MAEEVLRNKIKRDGRARALARPLRRDALEDSSRARSKRLIQRILTASAVALVMSGWAAAQTPTTQALAEVNGKVITAREVEKSLGEQLAKLEEQVYSLKRQKVEALIDERVLDGEASKRGITVQALLDAEVNAKAESVTPQEVENFYQGNKAQLTGTEAAVREQIRTFLHNQKVAARREAFLQLLRSQARVVMHLEAPPVFRAEVPTDGAPARGPAAAPVTIVEFEDFQCPFCKEAQATLAELLSKYPETVRLVHRDFPLDSLHPGSPKSHEAARCAGEQGKFWAYHDKLYGDAPGQGAERLKELAREIGLDMPAFERCVASAKYQAAVQKDVQEGKRLGVNGTPAFFINGRLVWGAQPLDNFIHVIQEELARPALASK